MTPLHGTMETSLRTYFAEKAIWDLKLAALEVKFDVEYLQQRAMAAFSRNKAYVHTLRTCLRL